MKVVVLLAHGFEEIEAFAVIDILRRAEVSVTVAGVGFPPIESARKVSVNPDCLIDDIHADDYDVVVLPGGQPGADNLHANSDVRTLLERFRETGKLTAAICAAPYVLAAAGMLEGKDATAYPSYREQLAGAVYADASVVDAGSVITSRGPATAAEFAFRLVERIKGNEVAEDIRRKMLFI